MSRRLPVSPLAATELVEFFKEALVINAVKAGETVLVYGDSHTQPHYKAAFMGAAMALGCTAVEMTVPTTSPAVQPWGEYSEEVGWALVRRAWRSSMS